MKFRIAISLFCMTLPVMGQGQLDERAWRSISDKLATYFPAASADYKVQFPSAPLLALWADPNNLDGIQSLNTIAGTIPPWSAIWASGPDIVSERYGFIVEAIDPPPAKNVNPSVKEAALKKYEKKYDALKTATKKLRDGLAQERKDRADQGLPFPVKDQLAWWSTNGGALTKPLSEFQDASKELGKLIDPNSPVYDAIQRYRDAAKAAATNPLLAGSFPYDGSALLLKTIVDNGKAADSTNTCTGGWTFNHSTSVAQSSSSSWGASGSYGPFVSIGGSGTHTEDLLKEDGTYISILFCSVGYVPVSPLNWYSSGLLELLKDGQLKLQSSSILNSKRLFGENGWLSRLPVGVIVAYKPRIQAKLSSTYNKTTTNSWNGGASIGFGPIRLGGNGGNSSREQVKDNQDGSYTYPAPGDQPYILAVVSKQVP